METDADELAAQLGRLDPPQRLVRFWELTGGTSARMTAVETDAGTLAVRSRSAADLEREFALLRHLHASGLPVPAPLHVESEWLVTDFVDGESGVGVADPSVLADVLAQTHAVPAAEVSFLDGDGALLHGDFWPGNTLWRKGRLVAVIDWEDAARGNPLADVANARLELLWSHGRTAMEEFTLAYVRQTGIDAAELPAWDLRADRRLTSRIAEWGLDPAEERRMLAARYAFVAEALAALPMR
jgi:aminoglycoside phosphotransferase (APT) family kinase protein